MIDPELLLADIEELALNDSWTVLVDGDKVYLTVTGDLRQREFELSLAGFKSIALRVPSSLLPDVWCGGINVTLPTDALQTGAIDLLVWLLRMVRPRLRVSADHEDQDTAGAVYDFHLSANGTF